MLAIAYTGSGPLRWVDADVPEPGDHDVLVEVKAIAVNPVDTKIRGRVKPPEDQPKILGWDAVGIVVATGPSVTLFNPGDRIWYAGDVSRAGCNAQYQCIDERICAIAPESLSDADAAAMPLTTITAWEMLFDRLQLPMGAEGAEHNLLVVGAGGGVGSMLVQLASKLSSATVIGTASRPESRQWVESLGAHHVIDHTQPLKEQLAALGIPDVTLVASVNRTDQHYAALCELMRPQGRLALIDDPVQPLDIKLMKQKSLSLHWEFMFTRPLFQTRDILAQHHLLTQVARLVDQGTLKTTTGANFGLISPESLEQAHQAMKTEHTTGKVVLEGFAV
ncbi:zinc-binding alcohol dehydrogenase family protein [Pseudohongiella spirulinae]|uniref:Zinc-type alcohol dehydrogenase-like protein n=1 Tax=Pseudohongiella spirulinae TaxID=1249552 RepID=A0A0S2KCZ6_9GAMM|nr:zinc-binding alcohol dehydrogenase family protein [Pseudohongiella spirulinae]ALO45982.1 Putative oxidoreductase [Pseudohongiella spirulinae]